MSLTGIHEVDGDVLQDRVLNVGIGVAAGVPVAVGNMVGYTLEAADSDGNATVRIRRLAVKFNVRNVVTYSSAAEATFGAIAQGDLVYIDDSATMPTGTFLSTSPLNADGDANILYGTVIDGSLNGLLTATTNLLVEMVQADCSR